ncbi:hypothetical protein MauCBS54593_003570 [Microsporum audouinii]
MPPEVRSFLRGWVAAIKQLPVDHPEIQKIPICFEGFGETLYKSSTYEIESYFTKNHSERNGATRSLAKALRWDLRRSREKAKEEDKLEIRRKIRTTNKQDISIFEKSATESIMVSEEDSIKLSTSIAICAITIYSLYLI